MGVSKSGSLPRQSRKRGVLQPQEIMMLVASMFAAVALLPEGGTNLVFGAWEDSMPFAEVIIRPSMHDFTAYDRCVLDYIYLGDVGESIHMYFAGDKEVFGKDDVLANRKTIWGDRGQWVFRLSGWPKCTDPKQITRIRIRTDYSRGGELWLRRLTLLKPGEALGSSPPLSAAV